MAPHISQNHIFRTFHILLLSLVFLACTTNEDLTQAHKNLIKEAQSNSPALYKGVFATKNSHLRGVVEFTLPDGKIDFDLYNETASGTLTLNTGEEFEIQATESSNFNLAFESDDISFNFTLDENDEPLITDVIFQDESSSIVAAEETTDSKVTPVTGTYKCTNCQDQTSTVSGIDLNNNERIFNMLLTTADGKTNLSIQALVENLIDVNLVINESCITNEQYTFCMIKSGDNFMEEPLTWSGVHRYTAEDSDSEMCSGISGVFEYSSAEFGLINGEFKSDNNCPNTTYFVSPAGNDSNTGVSPQDPWKSISKINSIDLQPGDAVLFEGSNEYNGSIILNKNDANNSVIPIKISSYGTGKATIRAGDEIGIYAHNTSGIIIDNLIIAGSGMNSNTASGIYFYNDLDGDTKLDMVEITNCEVFGFRDFGIVIGGWNGNSGYSNVLIENNKVHDILDAGISSYGEFSSTKTGYAHANITVRNAEVYNIKGYSKNKHSGNGIVLSDVQKSVIEHCTVYDSGSGNTNCGGPVGIWYWDSDQVTIQYSEVYNMSSGTGCDGGGFDMDGGVTNGLMQYNYSHDNDGAGFLVGQFAGARLMQNITVRYNISENDAATNGGSVNLFNGQNSASMKDIYVYNNTLYLSEKSSNPASATIKYTYWKPLKENINIFNNILYAENGADLVDVPKDYEGNFFGNLYFTSGIFRINYQGTTYNSLEAFRGTGNEIYEDVAVGSNSDPLLKDAGNGGTIGFGNLLSSLNAYKLEPGSPAPDVGIHIAFDTGSRDFYGNLLPNSNSKNVGAHEFHDSTKAKSEVAAK